MTTEVKIRDSSSFSLFLLGCFLLLQLIESEENDVTALIRSEIEEDLKRTKKNVMKTKGGELLLQSGVFQL